jgi:hypothetical protein
MRYRAQCIEKDDCGYTTWVKDDTQTRLCPDCDRLLLYYDPWDYLERPMPASPEPTDEDDKEG